MGGAGGVRQRHTDHIYFETLSFVSEKRCVGLGFKISDQKQEMSHVERGGGSENTQISVMYYLYDSYKYKKFSKHIRKQFNKVYKWLQKILCLRIFFQEKRIWGQHNSRYKIGQSVSPNQTREEKVIG